MGQVSSEVIESSCKKTVKTAMNEADTMIGEVLSRVFEKEFPGALDKIENFVLGGMFDQILLSAFSEVDSTVEKVIENVDDLVSKHSENILGRVDEVVDDVCKFAEKEIASVKKFVGEFMMDIISGIVKDTVNTAVVKVDEVIDRFNLGNLKRSTCAKRVGLKRKFLGRDPENLLKQYDYFKNKKMREKVMKDVGNFRNMTLKDLDYVYEPVIMECDVYMRYIKFNHGVLVERVKYMEEELITLILHRRMWRSVISTKRRHQGLLTTGREGEEGEEEIETKINFLDLLSSSSEKKDEEENSKRKKKKKRKKMEVDHEEAVMIVNGVEKELMFTLEKYAEIFEEEWKGKEKLLEVIEKRKMEIEEGEREDGNHVVSQTIFRCLELTMFQLLESLRICGVKWHDISRDDSIDSIHPDFTVIKTFMKLLEYMRRKRDELPEVKKRILEEKRRKEEEERQKRMKKEAERQRIIEEERMRRRLEEEEKLRKLKETKEKRMEEEEEEEEVKMEEFSKILSPDQYSEMNRICGFDYRTWKRVFRGSENFFSCERFHENCDSFIGTLTIVQTEKKGYVLGGFNPGKWASVRRRRKKNKGVGAWVFGFPNNPSPPKKKKKNKKKKNNKKMDRFTIDLKHQVVKIEYNPQDNAIPGVTLNEDFGPSFGWALIIHDLCDKNNKNSSTLDSPKNQKKKKKKSGSLLAMSEMSGVSSCAGYTDLGKGPHYLCGGNKNFKVFEYEVFTKT